MSTEQQDGSKISRLELRIARLEDLFVRFAEAQPEESILSNGFDRLSSRLKKISDRLEPLLTLSPTPPKWTDEQQDRLRNLYAALVPPKKSDVRPMPPAEGGPVGAKKRSASP